MPAPVTRPHHQLPTETWELDPARTTVTVTATKLGMFSAPATITVSAGTIEIGSDEQVRSAEFIAEAASYTSGNSRLDGFVRGREFLNASDHPHLVVRIDTVTARRSDGRQRADGSITVKGRTAPIAFDITDLSIHDGHGSFRATTQIDRVALGIGKPAPLILSRRLQITVTAHADLVTEAPAPPSAGTTTADSWTAPETTWSDDEETGPRILAIPATNNTHSINRELLVHVARRIGDAASVEFIDLNDFEMPIYSPDREAEIGIPATARALFDRIGAADGVMISFAEHNGHYSAAWKNAFDWMTRLDQAVFQYRPVAMFAATAERRGGADVLASARLDAPLFGADVVGSLSIASFATVFDSAGGDFTERRPRDEVGGIADRLMEAAALEQQARLAAMVDTPVG